MTKAKWRRKLAVLLSICVLGTSGAVPDPASITFAAFGGENSAATGSNADNLPESGPSSETSQTPDSDMSAELATSSNAQGIIVEFEDYEDEESPMELICVEEDTPIEDLPLPETMAVSVQKVEQQSEIATPSDAGQNTTQNTAPDATSSDADQASPSDADTDEDLVWEDEIELINDLGPSSERQESAQESMEPPAINPDAETISIDLPVGWVQAEGEEPYTGEGGQSANFIPTWDYEAYPLAEGYEPNLFVTVLVGDYPSLDQLETDGEKAISFVFSDEDTQEVEDALEREIPAAHGSVFNPLMRFFKAAEDYRFDNYYILYENNLGPEKTREVQNLIGDKSETKQLIKYQIDFHSDVQYKVGDVKIQVPYSIYDDRYGNGVKFSDIGIPEAPNTSNSSSFSYTIDEDDNKIVITNNKVIQAGSNNFFQIFYALDDLMTEDGKTWEIQPELFIEGEKQEGAGRTLTGSMDTEALLTVTEMKKYIENNKRYYPELYTITQVERALKRTLPDSYKEKFNQYRFVLWITEICAEASQPWTLTITDTPGEDGQVVGQYLGKENTLEDTSPYFFTDSNTLTWDAVRYGMGTRSSSGLDSKLDRGSAGRPVYLYTVVAYPVTQTNMTNAVKVELKEKDRTAVHTLEAQDSLVWEAYDWKYDQDVISIQKNYGEEDTAYSNMADSWLQVYERRGENLQDTELPEPWVIEGNFQGYSLTMEDGEKKYEYTLGTADDFMYASSGTATDEFTGKVLLTDKDYYYSEAAVQIKDLAIDIYEDMTSVCEDGEGADIQVMVAGSDSWESVTGGEQIPYKDLLDGYELPEEWLKKGVYRIRVEHTTDQYDTNCKITVKTVIRHDSPVFQELLEKETEKIQIENLGAVYGKTTNPKYKNKWYQVAENKNDFNYEPYQAAGLKLKERTWELYNEQEIEQDNTTMRWNDTLTLTNIREISEARKYGTARNNPVDGQVDLTYQLTAYEGYRVFGAEALSVLEDNHFWPVRNEVVFYDLLPVGITFNPSRPVTVGYLTDKNHREISKSWNTEGVKVTTKVEDDYKKSGRQMVTFTLTSEIDGRDNLEMETNTHQYDWWSGWGVEFEAYYSWEDAEIASGAKNLMAYQVREAAVLGDSYPDDGSWAGNLQPWLTDLDNDKNQSEKNILWDETEVSLSSAVSGQAEIKKTVREDADLYGVPGPSARVQPGKTYTYTLTLTNGDNELQDLVIFDHLENAVEDRKDEPVPELPLETTDWKGTFVYTNVEALKARGIQVKIYYSENRNAPIVTEDGGNTVQGKNVLTEENGWKPAEDWKPEELDKVQAIAYDLTTKNSNQPFVLGPMESLTLDIQMKAPETMPTEARYAYNNPAYYATIQEAQGSTQNTVVGDYTRVELYNTTKLFIEKERIEGEGVSKDTKFPFQVSIGGEPYAYREYKLYERKENSWISVPGLYGTNRQGILFLKEGQRAEFQEVPIGAKFYVEEQAGFSWESKPTGNEGTLTADSENPNYAKFVNVYHPLLYFEKEVLYANENTPEDDEFTFQLEINDVPAGKRQYFKVNPEGDMRREPEVVEPHGGLLTEEDGTFKLKAGERICLRMNAGDKYRITESENSYGEETDYDCAEPEVTGEMKGSEIYSYAKITNSYRWRRLEISKQITAKENGEPDGEKAFTFQIRTGMDEEQLAPLSNETYTLIDGRDEEIKRTDENGKFTLRHGDHAVFSKMRAGWAYQVEELQTDPDYKVREPYGGIAEGTIPKYSSGTEEGFVNDYLFRDLIVKKTVVYPPELKAEVDSKNFTFVLEQNGELVKNMSYKKLDEDGDEMSGTHQTDDNGQFTLKHGESAVFDCMRAGDTYCITEKQETGYMQTLPENGKAAEGKVGVKAEPTTVRFENRTTQSSLRVKKTVNPMEGTEPSDKDKETAFPFYLTIGTEPWGEKSYQLWKDGEKVFEEKTDADGGFTLMHGQTAVFDQLPYGIAYQVTETEQEGYHQISPIDGTAASGIITSGVVSADFVNQRSDEPLPQRSRPLVIEKKLIDGDSVPVGFAEWILSEFDYDSQNILYDALRVRVMVQINEKPYIGTYEVLGPGNRKEIKTAGLDQFEENGILEFWPGQRIVIPNLKIGSRYKVSEFIDEKFAGNSSSFPGAGGESIWVERWFMEPVIPKNYGSIEGEIKPETNQLEFINGLYAYPRGEHATMSLSKYVDEEELSTLEWDDKYRDEQLTLRLLKKEEDGSLVPAEGIVYQVYSNREEESDNEGNANLPPYPVKTVGSDGKIILKPYPYESEDGETLIGGMMCLLRVHTKHFLEDYRIEEVAEETSEVFGEFAGAYASNMYSDRVYVYDTTEEASLMVSKTVMPESEVVPDKKYKFQLTSGIKNNEDDYELPYLQAEEQVEANRPYRLGDLINGKEIEGDFQTDENGIFYLQHGQGALFEGLTVVSKADERYDGTSVYTGRLYHVKELAEPDCEVTTERYGKLETNVVPALGQNEAVMLPGVTDQVVFINNYDLKPGLTIYKEGRGGTSGTSGYPWAEQEFTFTLKVDGKPYANEEYQLFSVTDGEITNGDDVPWTTNEYGEFTMMAGEYVKFDWIGTGKHYEISETPEKDFIQVSPAAGTSITGVIGSTGNEETFVNQYNADAEIQNAGQIAVRKSLSFPSGLAMPEDLFQFQIFVDGKEYSAQEFKRFQSSTNAYIDTGTTDLSGQFTLEADQYALFDEVERDLEYEVREILPEDSIYQILSPKDGTTGGVIVNKKVSEANFVNGIAAFMVTKAVTNAPGSTAPEDDEFTFEVKTDGTPLTDGRYWLYNSQNERVDDQTYETNEKGQFTLQAGQKALFIGIKQGTKYEVRELSKPYYTQIVPVSGGIYEGTVTEQVGVLAFENRYSREAALSVTKEVKDSFGNPAAGDTTSFTFQLMVNKKAGSGRVYTLNDSNTEYRTDGEGKFQLAHGDTAHFSKLREGDECVIKELDIPEGYQAETPSVTARLKAGQSLGVDVETGAVSPGVTEETQVVFVNRKVPTIWVENTTGDDTPETADDNQGGMVAVLDAETDAIIPGSQSEISSGGTDDNTQGRYRQTAVTAIPEASWQVSIEDITFGPMERDGQDESLSTRLGDLKQRPRATDPDIGDFYNSTTGSFRKEITMEVDGQPTEFTINGTLELAEDGQATVTIDPLPFDMDIGFCFKAKQYELPKSGGSGNLPFALTGLALMYLSAWELKRRKRRN